MNQKPDAEENSSSLESFIPHAKFRIARSYQKMQFHSEASQYFEQLRQQFPNSMEAVEAIFWKAVTQVDRRNWGQAIENFKEYLRTSPAPKHLAVTHYKLAQAYYQQGRFITAREHFDTARDLNTAYVRHGPVPFYFIWVRRITKTPITPLPVKFSKCFYGFTPRLIFQNLLR